MRKLPPLVVAAFAVLSSACGVQPTDAIYGAQPTPEDLDSSVVFFLNDDVLTRVTRPPTDPFKDNLTLLGEGPTGIELGEGLSSEIPPAAAPITMIGDDKVLTVHISSPVVELSATAQDQIVCTAAPPWATPGIRVYIIGSDNTDPVDVRICPYRA